MALNKAALSQALADLNEGLQSDPPTTTSQCAAGWSGAMSQYAAGVVPASSAVAAASSALESALAAAFESEDGLNQMESAFASFAATVAGGMAPAFTATPPPAAVGFADQTELIETAEDFGNVYADLIDAWMTTGEAVPSGGGATVEWS